MADTIRPINTLLTTLFQDGQTSGSITAKKLRDLIVSVTDPVNVGFFPQLSGSAAQQAIANITSNVVTNTTNIAANSASLATLQSLITNVSSSVSTNAGLIGTLQTQVTSVSSSVVSNNTKITSLSSSVVSNTANIVTNTTNISSNSASIIALSSSVVTNTANIVTNTNNIGLISSSVVSNNTKITSLSSSVVANTANIVTNTANISSLSSSVASGSGLPAVLKQYSSASYSMNYYANMNAGNASDTLRLNPGLLVYGDGTASYGMDLGYNYSKYRTRIFAPGTSDIAFSFVGGGVIPTSHSLFIEAMTIRGDSLNVGVNNSNPYGTFHVNSKRTDRPVLMVQAASGQTDNIQVWADSSGNGLLSVDSGGFLNSYTGQLVLKIAGVSSLRNLFVPAWTDNVSASFFQLGDGTTYKSGLFTTNNGQAFQRFGICSTRTNISNTIFNSASVPSSILQVANDASTASEVVFAVRGGTGQTGDLVQYQAVSGTVLAKIDATGSLTSPKLTTPYITTPSTELVFEQTGDTYGTTRLRLRNRNGSNGAVFESPSLGLVDFGFINASGSAQIRFESRPTYYITGTPEFQINPNSLSGSAVLAIGTTMISSSIPMVFPGGLKMRGYTSATTDPTTTQLPNALDYGIHKNTTSGTVFLAFNDGGTVKKVALT